MKLYPSPKVNVLFSSLIRIVVAVLILTSALSLAANAQTELVFKNSSLQSGTAGADGAVYRFPNVTGTVDALVKINGRSSGLVTLTDIDLTSTGFDKSFQPQVTYNNGTTNGAAEWYMEFQISFVQSNTNTPVAVSSFQLTNLDNDGNGDKLNEYVSVYNQVSWVLEANTQLTSTAVNDHVLGLLTSGRRFDGPITNYAGIDTAATAVMVTNNFANINSLTVRAGGRTTGATSATDRMYSFWFKGFTYTKPVQAFLPVTLVDWTATYSNSNVSLKWTSTVEKNASHYIVERSTDGVEYSDIAMIVAAGNSNIQQHYSWNDKVPAANSGVVYYRLQMVDLDGRAVTSDIRVVRMGQASEAVKLVAFPNPVVTDVRVSIPQTWQDKAITYQLMNIHGQVIKAYTVQHASQTETINMSQAASGMYIIKVSNGTETATQTIIKATN